MGIVRSQLSEKWEIMLMDRDQLFVVEEDGDLFGQVVDRGCALLNG